MEASRAGSFVSPDQPCHLLHHLHPGSFMWIKACRLFNSSFERRGDQGEAGGGARGVGRVSVLCRCGTSLAGQCQAALWGDETGPPQWTNAL